MFPLYTGENQVKISQMLRSRAGTRANVFKFLVLGSFCKTQTTSFSQYLTTGFRAQIKFLIPAGAHRTRYHGLRQWSDVTNERILPGGLCPSHLTLSGWAPVSNSQAKGQRFHNILFINKRKYAVVLRVSLHIFKMGGNITLMTKCNDVCKMAGP